MQSRLGLLALGLVLAVASPAPAQVVGGVLYVNNTHMSWWGGVARDATARLYDVDADTMVMDKKAGTIIFRAKKGQLVDLDKLHESVRATRLGDSTGMELKVLDVTAVGEVVVVEKETRLKVTGSDQYFVLISNPSSKDASEQDTLARLQKALAAGEKVVSVTGRVEDWNGNFTQFLKKLPGKPRRIVVKDFQTAKP